MSTLTCRQCGSTTNTALCDHINSKDDMADRCFAKFDFSTVAWVKGCAYDEASEFEKAFADKCIEERY